VPIYDYVCGSCGHRFEQLRGLNEAGPHQCPVCGGAVTRAFAPPTIVFKGSGWAKVDRRYAGAPTKKATPGEGSGAGSGGSGQGSGGSREGSGGDSSDPGSGGSSEPAAAPATGAED
jgi:putative FmdB family regulatory protein